MVNPETAIDVRPQVHVAETAILGSGGTVTVRLRGRANDLQILRYRLLDRPVGDDTGLVGERGLYIQILGSRMTIWAGDLAESTEEQSQALSDRGAAQR